MTTSRLETFSDGVFSIAITLLVLDFHPPADGRVNVHYLSSLGSSLVAYIISFLLIGLIWANHHSMFNAIHRANRPLIFWNLLLLASVALLPFPTSLLATALRTSDSLNLAAFCYGLTLTVGGLFFNGVWVYATRQRSLLRAGIDERFIARSRSKFLVGPLSYGLTAVIALFLPYVAVGLYALLIVYYWFPPRGEDAV